MNATNVITLNAAHAVTHEERTKLPTREMGCALPRPAFATMEEVHYAHELRLRLRAYFLRAGNLAACP
jgi:hypothetical protein